jgi:drug/metabolite transporter (DMT)-like permease
MSWFLLALTSAVSLAFTDLFAKKVLTEIPVPVVAWARVAFPLPILAAVAAIEGWASPHGPFWATVACALPLEWIATLLYQTALQRSPLGLTTPYLAFTPAFLVVAGRWVLGESAGPLAHFGIALVTAGGYLIQLGPNMGPLAPFRALLWERGSVLMLAVSVIYSFTSALGKLAVLNSSPTTFAFLYYLLLTGVLGPQALVALKGLPAKRLRSLAPVSLFGTVMILSHFLAIRIAPASHMIAVKRTSLLWSILLGRVALGEGNLKRRLLGGSVMLAGALTLGLAL